MGAVVPIRWRCLASFFDVTADHHTACSVPRLPCCSTSPAWSRDFLCRRLPTLQAVVRCKAHVFTF
jgi:hypothetical protein